MFLWVELVIGNLEFCSTENELLGRLRELPGSLQEA